MSDLFPQQVLGVNTSSAKSTQTEGKTLQRDKELVSAAFRGNYEVVKQLLEKKADLNAYCSLQPEARLGSSIRSFGAINEPLDPEISALQAAAKGGHQDVVQLLINKGANVNTPASENGGRTALQAAAEGGYEEVVELLMNAKADVNAPPAEHDGRTALQAAAEGGYEKVVGSLINANANVNAPPAEFRGRTALQAAAEFQYVRVVKLLLDSGADVNTPPAKHGGVTALQAAADKDYDLVNLILASGAEVNAPPAEYDGKTALQAAVHGWYRVMELLIEKGANVNAPPAEHGGRTALQAAAEGGYVREVELLIEKGANVNALPAGDGGKTALLVAVEGGHRRVVELLINARANVNAPPVGDGGRNALLAAVEGGHEDVAELLINAGANCNVPPTGQSGRTVLLAAVEGGYESLVELLINSGANVNATLVEQDGRTALQAAAEGGHQHVVGLLVSAKANVNAPPAERGGRTALQAAAEGGHEDVVVRLLCNGADINAPPAEQSGKTALQAAAGGGHENVVHCLTHFGADVNGPPANQGGRTALQAAAEGGYEDVVEYLIYNDADVNAPPAEQSGRTALQAAAGNGYEVVVKLLISAGADVNAPPAGKGGVTALQAAASYEDIQKLLIAAGALDIGDRTMGESLVLASERGDLALVRQLLGEGNADVNARYHPSLEPFNNGKAKVKGTGASIEVEFDGWSMKGEAVDFARTALQAASDGGHEEVVGLLIEKGADINALPAVESGRTALQAAAESGHEELVRLLIEKGANVNALSAKRNGRTALQAAAEGGHEKIVELLTNADALEGKEGLDLTKDEKLVLAAGRGEYSEVNSLLKGGADINARCLPSPVGFNSRKSGAANLRYQLTAPPGGSRSKQVKPMYFARTALQAAAEGGHTKVVALLIEEKAYENALPVKRFGRTALQAAAEGGHEEVVKLLIEENANICAPPAKVYGRTALQAAAEAGNKDLVKFLIDKGANVNAPPAEVDGRTALQAAAEGLHKEVLHLLIRSHSDLDKRNRFGQNILHEACEAGDVDRLSLLLKLGKFDINAKDYLGSTPLHVAVIKNRKLAVKFLLENDVDVDIEDNSNETPLQVALEKGFSDILDILLGRGASTNGLKVKRLPRSKGNQDTVTLQETYTSLGKKAYKLKHSRWKSEAGAKLGKIIKPWHWKLENPSICWLNPVKHSNDAESLADPRTYLNAYNYPGKGQRGTIVEWAWLPIGEDYDDISPNSSKFVEGVPSEQVLLHLKSEKVVLVCYVCFSILVHEPRAPSDQPKGIEGGTPGDGLSNEEVRRALDGGLKEVKGGGIPNDGLGREERKRALDDGPSKGEGKRNLDGGLIKGEGDRAIGSGPKDRKGESDTAIKQFGLKTRKIEISWIMKEIDEARGSSKGTFLRSVSYRGKLNLKYLSIPNHGVEFFTMFLDDVRESWLHLFKEAKKYLSEMRDVQLEEGGGDPKIIKSLLGCSQQWNKLRADFKKHISISEGLLKDFRKYDVLQKELMVPGGGEKYLRIPKVVRREGGGSREFKATEEREGDNKELKSTSVGKEKSKAVGREEGGGGGGEYKINEESGGDNKKHKTTSGGGSRIIVGGEGGIGEEPEAIKNLSTKIKDLADELEKEISSLGKETKEMIELEFNLVSIYEARKSISMSVSMKRLSWITFIFLPLTFASGLFGMNIDLLDPNPSWVWYIVFIVPMLILVLLVWILFKYVPIAKWIEKNIGSRLKLKRNKVNTQKTSPSKIPGESSSEDSKKPDSTGSATMGAETSVKIPSGQRSFTSWLKRRPRGPPEDEENKITGTSQAPT